MGCPGCALLFGHPPLCYGAAGSKQLGAGGIRSRPGGSSSVVSPHEGRPAFARQCHPFLGPLEMLGKIKSGRGSGALCGHAGGRCRISMQNKTCLFSSSCVFSLAFNSTPKFSVAFAFTPPVTFLWGSHTRPSLLAVLSLFWPAGTNPCRGQQTGPSSTCCSVQIWSSPSVSNAHWLTQALQMVGSGCVSSSI